MELNVKSADPSIGCRISFKNAMLDLAKETNRFSLIDRIVKLFDLHLNDVKFNNDNISYNYIHFSKFVDGSFFDVFFGLEIVEANLQSAKSEEQVRAIYGNLFEIIGQFPISRLKININQHLATDENSELYLESLNPNIPTDFQKYIKGRGVYYTLDFKEHNLTTYITLVNSLFIPKGIYLSIENDFLTDSCNFSQIYQVTKDYYDFILKELKLIFEEA
jgi:hypothetical protein